jgi:hypothetical protein
VVVDGGCGDILDFLDSKSHGDDPFRSLPGRSANRHTDCVLDGLRLGLRTR